MVRAKFKVDTVTENGEVKMSPVYSGSAENESFFKATPGGSISLSIVNLSALAAFRVGVEYYVDFTEA